jgi:hypothetical protein
MNLIGTYDSALYNTTKVSRTRTGVESEDHMGRVKAGHNAGGDIHIYKPITKPYLKIYLEHLKAYLPTLSLISEEIKCINYRSSKALLLSYF